MSIPTTPDYRMRFPATTIDFESEVGITGQDHDNYPQPNSQARFDWMRLALISLLANQASYQQPTNYREGTIWFDLNTSQLKIWVGDTTEGAWEPLSVAIDVAAVGTTPITLAEFFTQFKALELRVAVLEGK